MRFFPVYAAVAAAFMFAAPVQAIESYPPEVTEQFTSWCTTVQGQPETACSCAVNKAALEIPASAMASFLSAAEGGGLAATAQGTGATALQIVSTCALGATGSTTGATGESLMKSLGGFGR